MIFFKKIQVKLVIALLLIGTLPLFVGGSIWSAKSGTALTRASFNQLTGIREIKKRQIESFFAERQGDIAVMVETVNTVYQQAVERLTAIRNNKIRSLELLANQWKTDITGLRDSAYVLDGIRGLQAFRASGEKLPGHDRNVSAINQFARARGYEDVFVMDMDGAILHAMVRKPDTGTGLALAFQNAAKGRVHLVDFSGDGQGGAAAFIAAPIGPENAPAGVVALRISTDQVQTVVAGRTGLGKTGESYLVGPDRRMRSTSFLHPETHSVNTAFAGPETGRADTEAVSWALAGEDRSGIILDYTGTPVLSSAGLFSALGLTWAVITEMNVAEAFNPVDDNGNEYYKKYIDAYGYYDFFLMDPEGFCFYSAAREADFQTNFKDGKFSDSNLGELFRRVMETRSYGITDFAPYAPSSGRPAAFIAQPVIHRDRVSMVVVLQLSLDPINAIMQQRQGLGKTGETYLVGPDNLMRSDSFLDPENHSVTASFARPETGQVDTDATKEAHAGKSDTRITRDYNGNPVLSAYTPVNVAGLDWILLAEIDEAEALAAVNTMKKIAGMILMVAAVLIVIVALFMLRLIMAPIKTVVGNLRELAQGEGDLTQRLALDCPVCSDVINCNATDCRSFGKKGMCWEASGTMSEDPDCVRVTTGVVTDCKDCKVYQMARYDELQDLSASFNGFVCKLQQMFRQVVAGVVNISSASTEFSAIAAQMSAGADDLSGQAGSVAAAAEEMSGNMASVSAATEQSTTSMTLVAEAARKMTDTIGGVNNGTRAAGEVTRSAVAEAESATNRVNQLGKAASEINEITEVITDISTQINLLSLNATIEAARAGEAGKGFAVVANEIKTLAEDTAEATGRIKSRIDGIQASTNATTVQIQKIADVIGNIDDAVSTIGDAVDVQTAATGEISDNVAQAGQGLAEVNENVAQSSTVSAQIARDISLVSEASGEMSTASGEVQKSAVELSETAENLKSMVSDFKL